MLINQLTESPLTESKRRAEGERLLATSKITALYEDYYHELSKLDENDFIVKQHCKFCIHPARALAEEHYEKYGSHAAVQKFFNDYCKEHEDAPKMNHQNISTHISQHYFEQQKKMWMREYSERILSVLNKKISDEHRIDVLGKQLEVKLNEIACDPTIDSVRQADAMSKLAKSISELMLVQMRMRGELQSVNLLNEKFTNVWIKVISSQNDPTAKKLLLDSLESFQTEMEGIPLIDAGGN